MNDAYYENQSTYKKDSFFDEATHDYKLNMINARAANNRICKDFSTFTANAINAVNGIAAQSNQFNMQAMTEIQHLMNDKFMLQMTIERMKRIRLEIPNEYSINSEGIGVCIKPNGIRITTGKIKIINIAEYKICKDGTYNDFIYVLYIDSRGCEKSTVIPAKNLASKNLLSSFIGFEYNCKKDISNEFKTVVVKKFSKNHWIDRYGKL